MKRAQKGKNILDLNGDDLDAEIAKIIQENQLEPNRWTEKEERILKELHGKVATAVIAKTLNRSIDSVINKLRRMECKPEVKGNG